MTKAELLRTPRISSSGPRRVPDSVILEALPGGTADVARVVGLKEAGAYYRLRRLEAEGRVRRETPEEPWTTNPRVKVWWLDE